MITLANLTPLMIDALTTVPTRALAVGQLADKLRGLGADTLRLVKEAHAVRNKPIPEDAEIDWWLEEADILASQGRG